MNDELYQKAVELRHRLHSHPELSNQETQTKKTLMEFIASNAVGVEITDCGKWFYAAYRSHNPAARTIAFRTEIDALPVEDDVDVSWRSRIPGVGHKCGHDGHAAALAAFAAETAHRGADNNVYFVFQHAEEIGGGGAECAALMEEKRVDEVFSVHNSSDFERGLVVVKPGTSKCASEGLGNGTDYPAIHTSKFDFIDEHIESICRLYGALAGVRS